MDWIRWRDEFPILSRKLYLNSCSLGALSRRAQSRVRGFEEEWHGWGAAAWYETWMGRLAELRGRVAAMLGAGSGERSSGGGAASRRRGDAAEAGCRRGNVDARPGRGQPRRRDRRPWLRAG